MDDLDALLEDLQSVVPRSERYAATTRAPTTGTSNAGNGVLNANNSMPELNGSSTDGGNNMFSSSTGGGPSSISPGITNASSNLAELDSLLESLNSPSLGMDLDDEALRALGVPDGGIGSKVGGGGYHGGGGGSYLPPVRPDMGNLLTSLDNAVSVDHGTSQGGGAPADIPQQQQQQSPPSPPLPPPPADASSATRDLDLLMASLNDFQMTTSGGSGGSGGGGGSALSKQTSDASQLYAQPRTMPTPGGGEAGGMTSSPPPAPGSGEDAESSATRLSQLDSMLGHLQSDLSRQGITSTSKGTCSACQKDIVGQVITALGRTWHPHHFICVCCKAELATQNFFEREGKAYCEKDYHEKFAPKCGYCDGPILERCMTALGKTWHPEHFICAHCGNPFGPSESFHEKDGQPYCRTDYYSLFAPKCGACDRPIADSFVSALKKKWHPECFNCMECGEAFKGGNFFEHDLMPYCEKHYYNRQGAVCSQCKKPVTGRCITAMGQKYHPEHFVCAFCMKQLSMGTFKEHGERPYCMKCYGKLFG